MTVISGRLACAKRGGPTFIEQKRVDKKTLQCPEGYQRCSDKTWPSETVCIEQDKLDTDCPIIDLFVINDYEAGLWIKKGFKVSELGYP